MLKGSNENVSKKDSCRISTQKRHTVQTQLYHKVGRWKTVEKALPNNNASVIIEIHNNNTKRTRQL